jgi:succinyl-CoA synthetase beta subunit
MKLYEFQGKRLFAKYLIPIPKGKIFYSKDDAFKMIDQDIFPIVAKAQVLVGGRGKAGGVKLIKQVSEIESALENLFGMDIKGYKVEKVLIEEGLNIEQEFYLSFMLNRNSEKITMITSSQGGTEIEILAEESPEAILKLDIDPLIGLKNHHFVKFFEKTKIKDRNLKNQFRYIIKKMYQMVIELSLNLVEINPLAIIKGNRVIALDSKIVVDDNGIPFLSDFDSFINYDDLTSEELDAKKAGLSYVQLNGNIGCIVNGAGLAMTTMDMIKYFGGEPANFLDVGGSSNPDKVINALKILKRDKNVKVILFNIFGGITRCDDIANGIKIAMEKLEISIPIVIRLTGTNEKEGVKILNSLDLNIATSMQEAVKKAVSMIGD